MSYLQTTIPTLSTPPIRPVCQHDWSKWEITKDLVRTTTLKRFCKVCWKLETKIERKDI